MYLMFLISTSFVFEKSCEMVMKIVFVAFWLVTYLSLSEAGKFFNIDNHRYYLSHPHKKNWHEAQRYCVYNGMVLVDIPDEDENNRILSIIKHQDYINDGTPQYWIGGTDLGSKGIFYWTSSGHSIMFSDYAVKQPDNGYNGREDCLEIRGDYGWKWNDSMCSWRNYFICRKPLADPIANCDCSQHSTRGQSADHRDPNNNPENNVTPKPNWIYSRANRNITINPY